MKNGFRAYGFLVLVFLVALSLVSIVNRPNVQVLAANVIVVPDDFPSVGLAVSNASSGDIVFVRAGQYIEGNILVDKSLTIVGEDSENTTINGNGTASFIFQVVASHVLIGNFTLERTNMSSVNQGPAIRIFSAVNVNIANVETREVYHGIEMLATNSSMIADCEISDSAANGLYLHGTSTNNVIVRNTIRNNSIGIRLASAGDMYNRIFHNNLVNNSLQFYFIGINYFDNGYPSGGNYFSDYVGTDVNYTAGQNVPGSDGIFDEPYLGDNYPLVNPFLRFHVAAGGQDFLLQVSTNVTIDSCTLNASAKTLELHLHTLNNFTGSARVEVPKAMLSTTTLGQWNVTVWENGNADLPDHLLALEDVDFTYLYFTFNDTATASRVDIKGTIAVPEYGFTAFVVLLAILAIVVVLTRAEHRRSIKKILSPLMR